MIINTKGVELNENVYINKEGKFLFKIEKFEEDGFTTTGDAKFKLHFKGVEVGTKEPKLSHTEMFSVGQKSLWKIKQLEVALKAPEVYDVNSFIGRWVIANIKSEKFTNNKGEEKTSYKSVSWEYSPINDKLPPIPEAVENTNDDTSVNDVVSDEEIPF